MEFKHKRIPGLTITFSMLSVIKMEQSSPCAMAAGERFRIELEEGIVLTSDDWIWLRTLGYEKKNA